MADEVDDQVHDTEPPIFIDEAVFNTHDRELTLKREGQAYSVNSDIYYERERPYHELVQFQLHAGRRSNIPEACFLRDDDDDDENLLVYCSGPESDTIEGLALQAHSYVLLQVSKDEQNRSNVDALIHKVVPSNKFDKFVQKLARKHNDQQTKFQQEEVTKDQREENGSLEKSSKEEETTVKNQEEMKLVQEEKKPVQEETKPEQGEKKPLFRASDFDLKPEIVRFRSNNKPSFMYKVDAKDIIRAIKEFLSSELVMQYTDRMSKEAASMYKNLGQGMNRPRTKY